MAAPEYAGGGRVMDGKKMDGARMRLVRVRLMLPAALALGLMAGALLRIASARQQEGSSASPASTIVCANLVYAGDRTSQCFSDEFLSLLSQQTHIHTDPHFHRVRLDSVEMMSYPFAVMTGEGAFHLSEKERAQLRYYLTHGGFVLASAGCSDPEWVKSFRAELSRIFPGERPARLTLDHPLFRTVYKIDTLATVHSAGRAPASIEAITRRGRIVLLFCSDGLNDTSHAENCCCCGGDEVERAEYINVNVLAYALLH
jgi:hypothetical protein